jgi:HlyD family secretion protein
LPPGNIKLRFFVAQALLPKIALGDPVAVACDGCRAGITGKISFIARQAEFTPPVIYSLEERNKLVFMVEARPDTPDGLRVGQPVQVTLGTRPAQAQR